MRRWGMAMVAAGAAWLGAAGNASAADLWPGVAGCPVDAPAMLAAPVGADVRCVTIGVQRESFTVGGLPVLDESKALPGTTYHLQLRFGAVGADVVPGVAGSSLSGTLPPLTPTLLDLSGPADQLCRGLFGPTTGGSQYWQCVSAITQIGALLSLQTRTTVAVEIVGPPTGFSGAGASATGDVVTVPVRYHFKSPLLGASCYAGSAASPVLLRIRQSAPAFGVTQVEDDGPVHLTSPHIAFLDATDIAIPAASGCGPGGLLDSSVNKQYGLPSSHDSLRTNSELPMAATTAGGPALAAGYHARLG